MKTLDGIDKKIGMEEENQFTGTCRTLDIARIYKNSAVLQMYTGGTTRHGPLYAGCFDRVQMRCG